MRWAILRNGQGGFSFAEFTVVTLLLGALASVALPDYWDAAERARAAEAFAYLSSVVSSQERYQTKNGQYSADLGLLDMQERALKYFEVGQIREGKTRNIETSWRLTLTRKEGPQGYGEYTVTFGEEGFEVRQSSIRKHKNINPISI